MSGDAASTTKDQSFRSLRSPSYCDLSELVCPTVAKASATSGACPREEPSASLTSVLACSPTRSSCTATVRRQWTAETPNRTRAQLAIAMSSIRQMFSTRRRNNVFPITTAKQCCPHHDDKTMSSLRRRRTRSPAERIATRHGFETRVHGEERPRLNHRLDATARTS